MYDQNSIAEFPEWLCPRTNINVWMNVDPREVVGSHSTIFSDDYFRLFCLYWYYKLTGISPLFFCLIMFFSIS